MDELVDITTETKELVLGGGDARGGVGGLSLSANFLSSRS
jgi:hypothetical protein